jgi:hypothetical protein
MEKETNTDTAKQTIVDAEEIKTETVEEGGKYDIIWLIAEPALFGYNTYVIVNNITLGGGYLWVALGIVINIGVALSYKSVFSNAVKKFNPNWAYAVLAVMLFIGIQGGYNDVEKMLEESAVPVVNEIIEDKFGKGNDLKCIDVKIFEEFSDNFYKARAVFNNGKDLEIIIENVNDKQIRVTIDPNQ